MTINIKERAKRCGELLARSPLDAEIKKQILDSLDQFTEGDLDRLLFSLEQEDTHLALLTSQLDHFDKQQNKGWDQLAKDQQKKAQEVVNDFSRQIERDVQSKISAEMK